MSDEVTTDVTGIGRRDFLRKSAMVGGMVWAAPVIQSMGAPAFAFTPQPGVCDISNIVFLLHNAQPGVRFKFEGANGAGCSQHSADAEPCVGSFEDDLGLLTQYCAADPGTTQATVDCSDPQLWTIEPADGFGVQWAIVMSGGDCFLINGPFPKGQDVDVSCFGVGRRIETPPRHCPN